ncbi:MAG: hypothetical protein FD123_513 [Bacteroidetes bacterium]|nr:MAG: hypothetical protein FD123_513 [Bacteroidota bacterium]
MNGQVFETSKNERTAASILSWIFHPILMVSYASALYFVAFPYIRITANTERVQLMLLMILLLTFFLPGLSTFIMFRRGRLSQMQLGERKERLFPLVYTAIIYMIALFMIRGKGFPGFIEVFLLGSIASLLLASVINFRVKVSLHALGIGGLAGGMLAAYLHLQHGNLWILALIFLLCGMIGTARLVLHAHRPGEIYLGLLSGFCIEFCAVFFLAFGRLEFLS